MEEDTMNGGIALAGLAGWAALIMFFALAALTNFAGMGLLCWVITAGLLVVSSIGILRHGFGN